MYLHTITSSVNQILQQQEGEKGAKAAKVATNDKDPAKRTKTKGL